MRDMRLQWGSDEGATSAELALVILLFVFVIFGIYQFSMGMYLWNSLTLAAQEGGRNAMIFGLAHYDGTTTGCDALWTTYVQPIVEYNLPGKPTDYTYNYSCSGTPGSTATMTIDISYSLMAGGQFGSDMTIPGLPLKAGIKVPLY
jgi:TadE-like protein